MGFVKRLSLAFRKKVQHINACDTQNLWIKNHVKLYLNLYKNHLVENALNVGDKLPITEVTTISGETLSMSELLKDGPVVIKFFRGTYCNYDLADLEFFSKFSSTLKDQGATSIAITTQIASKTKEDLSSLGGNFSVVSDSDTSISRKFGVTFEMPSEFIRIYKELFNLDLQKNHEAPCLISLPSTYVIDQSGMISYAYLDVDFRKRADIEEIIRFVKKCRIDKWEYYLKCEKEDCNLTEFTKSFAKKFFHQKLPSKFSLKGRRSSNSSVSSDEKDPLMFCLQTDEFLSPFKSFLSKTYCTENLLFYLETIQFQSNFGNLTDEAKKTEATRIIQTFVSVGSELEVNLDETTREKIMEYFNQGDITTNLFETASKETFRLMESDSFNKWRKTKEFSELWKRNGSLEFLSPVPTFSEVAAAA